MRDFLYSLGLAVRRWPVYAGLVALGLLALAGANYYGYRLLGDDNDDSVTEPAPPQELRAPSPH